ncbi:hypothetical protein [Salinibacterium sp. SWN1162]|uniref:hypothetical protein n=1 Tax=Salinibacterium sp. SWN1162 TaxID=2792053 RepID=UPI0018CD48AE|nr:hypothetical protein [Salinibacterium sp. SWN1162]MBH0009772.1 hypothetical protein [Salinibacterium sp. SWN1162]
MISSAGTRSTALAALALALTFVVTGCSSPSTSNNTSELSTTPPASSSPDAATFFPDVEEVTVTPAGTNLFDFAVTISSAYDTPEQYADGWHVLAPDGTVLGEHTLSHDHASEQPFTRTQLGVEIPPGITEVTIEGRDQANGYGGTTITVELPGR